MSIYAGGLKFDGAKPRYDLIPPMIMFGLQERGHLPFVGTHAMREVATAYARGMVKYEERNWERGMKYSRLVAAAMRHYHAYMFGEMYDAASKVHHLGCSAFGLMGLIAYVTHFEKYTQFDDRAANFHLKPSYAKFVEDSGSQVFSALMLLHAFNSRSKVGRSNELDVLYEALAKTLSQLNEDLDYECKDFSQFIPDEDFLSDDDLATKDTSMTGRSVLLDD